MKNQHLDSLYNRLNDMILELGKGNFAYRVAYDDSSTDKMEDIALMLNMLAEEMSHLLIQLGFFGEKNLSDPYILIVDEKHIIAGTNNRFTQLLKLHSSKLIHKKLSRILTSPSYSSFITQIQNFKAEKHFAPLRFILSFALPHNRIMDCWGYCHLVRIFNKHYYFFRGQPLRERNEVENSLKTVTADLSHKNNTIQLQADILIIKKVRQYILNNLHQSLPPLQHISYSFGINDFKLKKGFKELYNNTIFKFHLEKRLEMAMLLIKNTPTSLKVVAATYGFKNYSHFSKVFKKRYGQKPSYYKNKTELF